ncbi:Putative HTH CenpB-type DNA-binding domain-containing protein [Colletotrichum destructivum]|uniref:HTH CenpB-type DNA-binding domain-containing protein n=1 Tax=Colletotrichum destructivum TaxID=34406 RepID=A0AAX4J1F5_9PEZI|nr:Putative HTH CenpB-type DNA-binding domain-containing protein [Colletotrichum destructivum]
MYSPFDHSGIRLPPLRLDQNNQPRSFQEFSDAAPNFSRPPVINQLEPESSLKRTQHSETALGHASHAVTTSQQMQQRYSSPGREKRTSCSATQDSTHHEAAHPAQETSPHPNAHFRHHHDARHHYTDAYSYPTNELPECEQGIDDATGLSALETATGACGRFETSMPCADNSPDHYQYDSLIARNPMWNELNSALVHLQRMLVVPYQFNTTPLRRRCKQSYRQGQQIQRMPLEQYNQPPHVIDQLSTSSPRTRLSLPQYSTSTLLCEDISQPQPTRTNSNASQTLTKGYEVSSRSHTNLPGFQQETQSGIPDDAQSGIPDDAQSGTPEEVARTRKHLTRAARGKLKEKPHNTRRVPLNIEESLVSWAKSLGELDLKPTQDELIAQTKNALAKVGDKGILGQNWVKNFLQRHPSVRVREANSEPDTTCVSILD